MIRRVLTLCYCAIAFWAGMQVQQLQTSSACRDAGGTMGSPLLCIGAAP